MLRRQKLAAAKLAENQKKQACKSSKQSNAMQCPFCGSKQGKNQVQRQTDLNQMLNIQKATATMLRGSTPHDPRLQNHMASQNAPQSFYMRVQQHERVHA